MDGLTQLLDEARVAGLTLAVDGERLVIRGPRSAEALARRLLACKPELVAILTAKRREATAQDAPGATIKPPDGSRVEPAADAVARPLSDPPKVAAPCRCGSTAWVDVLIHGGRSTRRDCARCDRFLSFVRWYGRSLN